MSEPMLRDTFGDFLVQFGKDNKNIVVLDSDLSISTRTYKFGKIFPDRFFNMGVAEQNTVGTAIGLAISGKIPVVSGFSIFITGRAWEFIRLACHDNLNVKFITTHGGFVGEDGSTHHALEDLSLMSSLSNIKIMIPSDNIELIKILEYCFSVEGPFYIRLPRGSFPKIHTEDYKFSLGEPDLLKEGKDICLIGTGYGSILARESAIKLEKELNVSIKVLNLPCIKPIDNQKLIKELDKIKGIIIIEEHNIYCGFGSILARIISKAFARPMRFIGIENSFGQSGDKKALLNAYNLNKEKIKEYIKELLDL
ncbi:MAG: transketolase family protein [Candidatus Hodarchaeota archaeon]